MSELVAKAEVGLPIIEAVMMYWYNTDPEDIMRAVYVNPVGAYLKEKVDMYRLGLVAFWGQIDTTHKRRLVKAALANYQDEANRRIVDLESEDT